MQALPWARTLLVMLLLLLGVLRFARLGPRDIREFICYLLRCPGFIGICL